MAKKEDEKNEKIIRGLLKLTDNKRCINCNSRGPQYVCTSFWTFVCTNCSGMHREFTHRVKSISMAKFTTEEVKALQEGGNKLAKEIYFKEWDPQRNTFPDSSNTERLRDFIRHVYEARRYTGDRNSEKPPKGRMAEKEDGYENRSQGGSRSPPHEDSYDHRVSDRSGSGGRNPGYDPGARKRGDQKKSPRPEVVNDWHRDNRSQKGRKLEDQQVNVGSSSPPMVRPIKDILGENILPLRINEPPKASGIKDGDGSAHTQRTGAPCSSGSTDENLPEVKLETAISLIDFDADPEPPAAVRQPQLNTISQPAMQQSTIPANDNSWASFNIADGAKASQAPSVLNIMDDVLSQLSVPASFPGQTSDVSSGAGAPIPAGWSPPVAPVDQTQMAPFAPGSSPDILINGSSVPPHGNGLKPASGQTAVPTGGGGNTFVSFEGEQWPSMQHYQTLPLPAAAGQPTSQQYTSSANGSSSNQPWTMPIASNAYGILSTSQGPQAISISAQGVTSSGVTISSVEPNSSGRELPEGLFTTTYPSYPAPALGWQTGPTSGMGLNMQYNTATPLQSFQHSSKSTNPFDFGSIAPQTQTFPSMAPLQDALPNMSRPPSSLNTSSIGTALPAWMPSQPQPHPSGLHSQASATPSPFSSVGGNPFG